MGNILKHLQMASAEPYPPEQEKNNPRPDNTTTHLGGPKTAPKPPGGLGQAPGGVAVAALQHEVARLKSPVEGDLRQHEAQRFHVPRRRGRTGGRSNLRTPGPLSLHRHPPPLRQGTRLKEKHGQEPNFN